MNDPKIRVRTLAVAAALAIGGGVAFREWANRAPLSRWYRHTKRRRNEQRDDGGPNPEREPGTDPV